MKRILKKLAVISLLSLMSVSVFAQGGYLVKGSIFDALGPVSGATVMEIGTTNGIATDLEGAYALQVSSADAQLKSAVSATPARPSRLRKFRDVSSSQKMLNSWMRLL